MKYRELKNQIEELDTEDLDKDVIVYDELRDQYCMYADFSRAVGDYLGIHDGHPIIIISGIGYNKEAIQYDTSRTRRFAA